MKRLRALVLAILAVILSATPVYAIALPDSTPSVQQINVYRHLLEPNDFFVVIYANIPYGTPPAIPVTQAFTWQLIALDGITELASTIGYAYHTSGYGYNVWSMYVDNTTAPAWGAAYTARLSGNPAAFTTPPIYNFPIAAGDYSTMATQADAQAELATRILALATDLNIRWALTAAYSLLVELETGTVLSIFGETVFRGTMFGVQAMAPAAFQASVSNIVIPDRTWSQAYSANLTNQWAGTWVGTSKAAGTAFFGTGYDLLTTILVFFLCFLILILNIVLIGDVWAGTIDATVVMVAGARLGMYGLDFLALVAVVWQLYWSSRLWGIFR